MDKTSGLNSEQYLRNTLVKCIKQVDSEDD